MDEDLKRIASRIRSWRDEAGLTLQQLGDRAGVSASTIHKIENMQTVPTIAVLLKVAAGLSRRPSELLAEVDVGKQVSIVRAKERQNLNVVGGASLEHLTGMIPRNKLDLWRVRCEPGMGAGANSEPWEYHGEVVILVEEGQITAEVTGEEFVLEAGDSIHFDTTLPHRWVTSSVADSTVLLFALMPERMQGELVARMANASAPETPESPEAGEG